MLSLFVEHVILEMPYHLVCLSVFVYVKGELGDLVHMGWLIIEIKCLFAELIALSLLPMYTNISREKDIHTYHVSCPQ